MAFWIVSHIHSLKLCAAHLIQSTKDCPAALVSSIAPCPAALVESKNSLPESFMCSIHSFPNSLTLSTHECTESFTVLTHCFSTDSSFSCSATGAAGCSATDSTASFTVVSDSTGVSEAKSTALKSGAVAWTFCSSTTGFVPCAWLPEACTFCSSCVCVIT